MAFNLKLRYYINECTKEGQYLPDQEYYKYITEVAKTNKAFVMKYLKDKIKETTDKQCEMKCLLLVYRLMMECDHDIVFYIDNGFFSSATESCVYDEFESNKKSYWVNKFSSIVKEFTLFFIKHNCLNKDFSVKGDCSYDDDLKEDMKDLFSKLFVYINSYLRSEIKNGLFTTCCNYLINDFKHILVQYITTFGNEGNATDMKDKYAIIKRSIPGSNERHKQKRISKSNRAFDFFAEGGVQQQMF